jgi:transcriptional regulator with XRE-family HTH domain
MSTPDRAELLAAFGRVVRGLRIDLQISQEELADRAGIHRTYIGDVERGKRNVSLVNIERLARALEVDMAHLMARVDSKF